MSQVHYREILYYYDLMYFCSRLFGLSGIVGLISLSLSIGLITILLKYSADLISQNSCISLRDFGVVQNFSKAVNLSGGSWTCVSTGTGSLVVVKVPVIMLFASESGITVRNTFLSTNWENEKSGENGNNSA